MKLPNSSKIEYAQVLYKLETYTLNFDHSRGKHKARVFRSKLGITLENKEVLISALLRATTSTEAKFKGSNRHGDEYVVEFMLSTKAETFIVRSTWIIRTHEQHPRLVSVYPM